MRVLKRVLCLCFLTKICTLIKKMFSTLFYCAEEAAVVALNLRDKVVHLCSLLKTSDNI